MNGYQPTVVLKELTVSDAHSGTTSRQTFVYRNGYYDGQDNQFNGFQDVEVHTPDDGTMEAGVTVNIFDVGDTDRYFKGKLVSSLVTSNGRDLTFTSTEFDDCPLEAGLNQLSPPVRFICPLAIEVEHREGTQPSEWVLTRETHTYDVFGNTIRVYDEGVVSRGGGGCGVCERDAPQGDPCGMQCTGDELITDTEFATPDEPSDPWILRMPYRVETRTVDSADALATETLTYYDGPDFEGLPLGEVDVGLTTRVQERETSERFITRARNRYDVHGNIQETVDGRGFATLFGYDDRDLLLTAETLTGFEGPSGAYALRKEVRYHPVLEFVTSASNWLRVQDDAVVSSRATTSFGYSQYGELTAIAAPGDSLIEPTTTYSYLLQSPVSRIVEQTRSTAGGPFDLESVQCFDGRGRKFQGLAKVEDGRYLVDGYALYSPQGGTARAHQPHERTTPDCALSAPATVPFTEMFYDATGRTLASYDPDASLYGSRSVTTTTYRPLETLVYDPIDNEPSSPHFDTPSRSRVDGLGRTVSISRIVDANEPEVTLTVTYDALGRLQGLSDGLGYSKSQSYDLANRIVEERDPDRGVCTYAYDDTDNLLTRTDARGVVTERTYDPASRPLTEQDASLEASRIHYRYDVPVECSGLYGEYAPGARVEVDYPLPAVDGTITRALDCTGFDARGRVFQSERQLHGTRFVFTSDYDNADRMTSTTLPTGRVIETRYDGLSRVTEVPGLVNEIAYRESGEPERIERANGTVDTMSYDVRLRLDSMGVDGPGATSLLSRTLVRDRVSMVTNVVDHLNRSSGTPSADAEYTYDAAYRLIEAYFERARPAPPNVSGFGSTDVSAETLSVRYSPVDNILEKTSSLGVASRAHVGTYRYDSPRPHAVTEAGSIALAYDNSGNATTIGESTYAWDYRGKMVAATTGPKQVGTFAYDGDAIRVQRLEGPSTTWHISPGFEIRDGIATTWVSALGKKMVKLETTELAAKVLPDTFPLKQDSVESEPDGRITIGDAWVVHARREGFLPSPTGPPASPSGESATTAGTYGQATESLYGTNGPSLDTMLEAVAKATLIGTGEAQTHLHHDALATTALTTTESGALESATLHYPYGEWRHRSTDQLEVYSYTGVERDESTGLSANGARYLHLGLGRFTSPDPLFASLGTVLEQSPWEHNLYAYAGGNPVTFIDPSGLGREEYERALKGDYSGFTKGGINPDEVFAGVAESAQFAKTAAPVVAELATAPFGASAGGKVVGAVKATGVLAKIGGAAKGAWNWTKGLFTRRTGKKVIQEAAERAPEAQKLLGVVPRWTGKIVNYKKGAMTPIEHIFYRHGPKSGFDGVGKFASGTRAKQVAEMVTEAARSGQVTSQAGGGFSIVHDFKRAIGTHMDGSTATRIQVYLNEAMEVMTAYPMK